MREQRRILTGFAGHSVIPPTWQDMVTLLHGGGRQRTIAEADGAMKYADPGRARLQLLRDTELRRAGYEVVHFTWHEITARPEEVIAQIRAAFERSAWLRAAPQAR